MSTVESRKVQVGAGGSFLLVLPKEWARKMGLKKGDRLDIVIEDDGSLRVAPPLMKKPMFREAELELDSLSNPRWLDRCIKAAYMQGYDVIAITYRDRIPPEIKKAVKASTLDLVGMEVADIQPGKMVLRILVDPLKFPLAELKERTFALLLSMANDLTLFLERREESYLQDVVDREEEVAKLYRLMVRQSVLAIRDKEVAKAIGVVRLEDNITNVMIARDILRLALLSARLANTMMSFKDTSPPSNIVELLIQMSKEVLSMLERAFRSASQNDQNLAHSVIDSMERVRAIDSEVTKNLLSLKGDVETALALNMIVRDFRRMAGSAVAIADSVITGSTPSRAE